MSPLPAKLKPVAALFLSVSVSRFGWAQDESAVRPLGEPSAGDAPPAAAAATEAGPPSSPSSGPEPAGASEPLAAPPEVTANQPVAEPTLATAPRPEEVREAEGRPFRQDRELEFPNGHPTVEPKDWLEFHGNLQVDAANVDYSFRAGGPPHENLYDFRGRFVLGPTLWHRFGGDWFVRARAELVAWLRQVPGSYQASPGDPLASYLINVDDVFAQVGQVGRWDFKMGRFFSWRVYHRGPGFDLFTTEDLGACRSGDCALEDPAAFAPRMYDVSNIYFRESAGRAALHLYPTRWSGVEALVQYGSGPIPPSVGLASPEPGARIQNQLGGRLAGMLNWSALRVSAAFEARRGAPAQDQVQAAEGGGTLECPSCGTFYDLGAGGGVELTLREIGLEAAVNAGFSTRSAYQATTSSLDEASSGKTLSLGGYAQFDVGKYVLHRALILGAGYNYTQLGRDNLDYDQHGQLAAYALWPLDVFQGAAVKLVFSNAQLSSEPYGAEKFSASANSLRLRFSLDY